MPIASGIYVITNVNQLNSVFLENPNDEEPIQGHYKPENLIERWHWHVTDLKNGCHLIQNIEHKRYAYSGLRAGLNASVMGASEEQQWHIQVISAKGEYTIGAIDSPNFWMLPDKEKGTPVELFNIPTDRKCWWTFTNVETGLPVKKDAAYGAYLFALNPLPILPFSPLRLDFVIIQQIAEDSISNASRTVAGVCGPLVSLRRVQWDALCVGIIEVSSVRSDIFFERSCDVVSFEKLSNLESPDILWEGFHGASSLPTLAIRGLRAHATKILILNLSVTLFQQAGQAIINLIDGLAEHNITLILTPIQPTWEDAFSGSVVFNKLKNLYPEFRRFRAESQFSDYVVDYNKAVALPKLKKHPYLRDVIHSNIAHILEVLKDKDQNTRSAAVIAFSQLAEYSELHDAVFQTVPKIIDMLKGNRDEAKAATSTLIELAENSHLRHIICQNIPHIVEMLKDKNHDVRSTVVQVLRKFTEHTELYDAIFRAVLEIIEMFKTDSSGVEETASALAELTEYAKLRDVGTNFRDNSRRTSLAWAAESGHNAFVRVLLAQKDVEVDARTNLYRTPLSLAAEKGRYAVVHLLLAREGVDANFKDNCGQTPLSWAARNGHEAVVRLLLAHEGVDANSKDNNFGQTPLLWAVKNGHDAVTSLLLAKEGVDTNSKDYGGQTPLSSAAGNGQDVVVRLLLAKEGVDANFKDRDGWSPLSWAASNGHEAVVRLLLAQEGVDADSTDRSGRTPRSLAAANGHKAVAHLLPDPNKELE